MHCARLRSNGTCIIFPQKASIIFTPARKDRLNGPHRYAVLKQHDTRTERSSGNGGFMRSRLLVPVMTSGSVLNFPVVEQEETITFFYRGCGN